MTFSVLEGFTLNPLEVGPPSQNSLQEALKYSYVENMCITKSGHFSHLVHLVIAIGSGVIKERMCGAERSSLIYSWVVIRAVHNYTFFGKVKWLRADMVPRFTNTPGINFCQNQC